MIATDPLSRDVSGPALAPLQAWFRSLVDHHASACAHAGERSSTLTIAGVPVRFRYAGEAMQAALAPALSHHAQAGAPPAFTFLLWDSAATPAATPPFPWSVRDVGAKGEVAAASAGPFRTAYNVGSRLLSAIDFERRIALCWTPDAKSLPWYERAAPMRTLLHWVLAAEGRNLVHAAAVAPEGGSGGVLMAGRGGSGKSTTAMLCLAAGFQFAGDDYVAVSNEAGGGWRVHSLFGSAKLTPASIEWLPFLRRGLHADPSGDEKGVVLLKDVMPDRLASSFTVEALVIPRVLPQEISSFRRSTAAEALRALAPTTIFQLPGTGAAAFEQLASLARGLPAWSLELGRDRDEIPALVARIVEES